MTVLLFLDTFLIKEWIEYNKKCLETGEMTKYLVYGKCLETGETAKSFEYRNNDFCDIQTAPIIYFLKIIIIICSLLEPRGMH